jgi:catecholate siderophore receptor
MRNTSSPTIRPLHRGIRAALGLPIATMGLLGSLAAVAAPQEEGAARVEEIVVTGSLRTDYLVTESTLGSKFTQSLRDTPQSITLLSQAMMQDRNVMSLDDALRNVPGITLNAGEMKWMGNGPTIRGFSSRNDMYIDGIRDLGFYSRDPFNLEAVEVLMGPSSMAFGRGSTGGVINQSSKKPFDEELRSLHLNIGNAGTRRVAADINQPLNDDARFRLNLMAHEGEVPSRSAVENSRYGIAPSLSLDLGDATVLTLNYLYQNSEGDSDYGLPWVGNNPAPVDRSTYYGFDNDWMDNTANVFNAIVDHALSDTFKLNAQLRYSDYDRSSRITEATVAANVNPNTPPENITVQRLLYSSEGAEGVLQGQVNLRADFATGGLSHTLVTGLELSRESAETTFGFAGINRWLNDVTAPVPTTSLVNPVGGTFNGWVPLRLSSDTTSDTLGVYALDTIEFNEQWQVMLGLRWDRFETDYEEWRYSEAGAQTAYNRYVTEDKEPSYRAALVYKPVEEGTVYLGWGTSFNPSTESVTQIDSGRGMSAPNIMLQPQENESIELGVKWSLLDGRLLLDASVFEIEKTGAYVSDPSRPGFNVEGGIQNVKGGSITLNGSLGEIMQMMVGYTRLDGETTNSLNGATGLMDNVPENSFNFWLNWSVSSKLGLGAGARYIDQRYWGTTKSVPDYWTADAMARYRYSGNIGFRLNVVNLTDERYIDQLHPWHLSPGAGRSIVFAVDLDY